MKLSDEEAIATWMEPKPAEYERGERRDSPEGWWHSTFVSSAQKFKYWPSERVDSLDALHLVEETLSEEQRLHYCVLMFQRCCVEARTLEWDFLPGANDYETMLAKNRWGLVHATAKRKIAALAEVLGEEAEARNK